MTKNKKEKIPAVEVMTKKEKALIWRKIPVNCPETYRCGVKLKDKY